MKKKCKPVICGCGERMVCIGTYNCDYVMFACDKCLVSRKIKKERQRKLTSWEMLQVEKEFKRLRK